jgi:hypothetical protein
MAEDLVKINGRQYDQGSVELKIRNVPIYGFTTCSWSQKRERVKSVQTGKSRRPRGRTGGKYTTEAFKITVRRDTASVIKLMLAEAATDGQSYGSVDDTPIVLQYIEDESNQKPVSCEFIDCALVSDGGNSEEDGPDMVELEFDFLYLDETIDGKKCTLYDGSGI